MLKLELQIYEISKHQFVDIHAWEYNLLIQMVLLQRVLVFLRKKTAQTSSHLLCKIWIGTPPSVDVVCVRMLTVLP